MRIIHLLSETANNEALRVGVVELLDQRSNMVTELMGSESPSVLNYTTQIMVTDSGADAVSAATIKSIVIDMITNEPLRVSRRGQSLNSLTSAFSYQGSSVLSRLSGVDIHGSIQLVSEFNVTKNASILPSTQMFIEASSTKKTNVNDKFDVHTIFIGVGNAKQVKRRIEVAKEDAWHYTKLSQRSKPALHFSNSGNLANVSSDVRRQLSDMMGVIPSMGGLSSGVVTRVLAVPSHIVGMPGGFALQVLVPTDGNSQDVRKAMSSAVAGLWFNAEAKPLVDFCQLSLKEEVKLNEI